MTMSDFDELYRVASERRDEFNDVCRMLYYAYEQHRRLRSGNSLKALEQVFAKCRAAELADESAKKDFQECYEREAAIATMCNDNG